MNKSINKSTKSEILLPLRVGGVDFHYSQDLVSLLELVVNVQDPGWSYFPNIYANELNQGLSTLDLILHPSMILHSPLDATDVFQKNKLITEKRRAQIDMDLKYYFRVASVQNANSVYLTPFELLRAMIFATCNKELNDNLSEKVIENYLSLSLSEILPTIAHNKESGYSGKFNRFSDNTPLNKANKRVENLMLFFRELMYQSYSFNHTDVVNKISRTGTVTAAMPSPIPYETTDPQVDFGEKYNEEHRFLRLDQPMHSLVLGATGTGKTHSVIIPKLKGHLAYALNDGTKGAAFIVDPKRELAEFTERFLAENNELDRLFIAGRDGKLNLFSKNTSLSQRDRAHLILNAVGMDPHRGGDSAPWTQKSMGLLMDFVDAHALLYNLTGRDLYVELMHAAGRDSSYQKGYWFAFRDVMHLMQEGMSGIRWVHQRMESIARELKLTPEDRMPFQVLARFASMSEEGSNQISYITGGLEYTLSTLCDESLSTWLDLSPAPEMAENEGHSYDLDELITATKVMVFQPSNSPSNDLGMTLVKAQFFRAAMERTNLLQPILYLCDEFQRFITSDRESGEATFLDRCRAYRITAVLATQSINSLQHAVSIKQSASNTAYAVDSILSNIAYFFYFQSADSYSVNVLENMMRSTIPSGWELPLNVVPLPSLNVGEAYYIAPQGKSGRTKFNLVA